MPCSSVLTVNAVAEGFCPPVAAPVHGSAGSCATATPSGSTCQVSCNVSFLARLRSHAFGFVCICVYVCVLQSGYASYGSLQCSVSRLHVAEASLMVMSVQGSVWTGSQSCVGKLQTPINGSPYCCFCSHNFHTEPSKLRDHSQRCFPSHGQLHRYRMYDRVISGAI